MTKRYELGGLVEAGWPFRVLSLVHAHAHRVVLPDVPIEGALHVSLGASGLGDVPNMPILCPQLRAREKRENTKIRAIYYYEHFCSSDNVLEETEASRQARKLANQPRRV